MELKVLGGGCAKCNQLTKNVQEALAELNIQTEIVKVTETADIMKHGVMSTPALVIDGKIVAVGRVMNKREIVKYISAL